MFLRYVLYGLRDNWRLRNNFNKLNYVLELLSIFNVLKTNLILRSKIQHKKNLPNSIVKLD